jgi:hypothetical protein
MKELRAWTLIEMLVVIGILMILCSIIFPIIAGSMQSAKEAKTKSNLHQIYLGLALYREKYDSKVEYGSTVDMGLPVGMPSSPAYLEVVKDKEVWRSPCCCHKEASTGAPSYQTYFMDYSDFFTYEDFWETYVAKYEGDAAMVVDMHCNDQSLDLYAPTEPIKQIGVRLNGKVETRIRTVSPAMVADFWNK